MQKYDLTEDIELIRRKIYEIYHNVISVEQERMEDPEIEDYEKVCFEIHISGNPAQILEDEDKFYATFFREIPDDKQECFIFTYCVEEGEDL